MAWQRWNATTKIFELSNDLGITWDPLELDAAVITDGVIDPSRLGSGSPSSSNYLRGDGSWNSISTEAFAVGGIYINITGTNPGTELGYGTWSAFGSGRVLVGVDSLDSDFDTPEKTSGEKTHTLTTPEIPSHTHTQNSHTHTLHDPGHTHTIGFSSASGGSTNRVTGTSQSTATVNAPSTNSSITGITLDSATAVNQNAGGGGSHNNVQPSIAVYFWKRTA